MEFEYLVFIGRFEPFHVGHQAVVDHALRVSAKVIVLIGSANKPRTTRNPWSAAERAAMIEAALGVQSTRVILKPLRDHLYNETLWISAVQRTVAEVLAVDGAREDARVGIVGQDKDSSSYYLREFPQWPLVEVSHTAALDATELRAHYFDGAGGLTLLKANVPPAVFDALEAFRRNSPDYATLAAEHRFIRDYKSRWAAAPYAPTFVTTDAVVVHSGHVLLVKRKAEPGKGLWALPGGFARPDQSLVDSALRELREETRLKIPLPVLRGSLKATAVFDHPDRSQRGRTITHAFHFEFPRGELPAVRGGDDADRAQWFPLAQALEMEPRLFEDHFHILEFFIGRG